MLVQIHVRIDYQYDKNLSIPDTAVEDNDENKTADDDDAAAAACC